MDAVQLIQIKKVGQANTSMRGGQQTSFSNMLQLCTYLSAQNICVQFGGEFLYAFQVEHLPVLNNHVTVAAAFPSTVSQTAPSIVQ